MAPAHRSPAQWLRDLARHTKPPASTSASDQATCTAVGTAESIAAQPAGFGRPENSTEHEGQRAIPFSGTCFPATQNQHPMNEDKELANEEPRNGNASRNSNRQGGRIKPPQPRKSPGISQDPPRDDDNPIWHSSIERFKREKPEEYKLMVGELDQIQKLKDGDTWDTWISRQDLDKDSTETKYE